MGSLKSFIKAVRKSKTIADERAVVRKESASIRTLFRDPNLDQNTRRVNILKLLYLYILGEKTHFGQVECLKLLASPRFADKRLGYLAVMLLLDENQEVLTLLTNSLDNDMQHPNTFIVGLALTCLGNLASPELARDLYADVDKILSTTNSVYLKKKAAVVAAKLVAKEPDLGEVFLPRINALLAEKTPLTLLGVCRMIQALYEHCPDHREALLATVSRLVSHLRRIVTSGYMPDYDVTGVTDPFLQVTLLETLRALATDPAAPAQALEEVNDILTQVASNLDSGKNAAHAVLYECAKTIFAIRADQSLRVLGVNLLGKFLSTKDNNTRYVALETLLTVIEYEPLAVQRHRQTVVKCLGDGDVSIRRRALELTFAILNEQNIRVLVRDIMLFLELCTENELKPYTTSQLSIAAEKYAPNEKWLFDTLVRMLKISGNFVTPDIVSNILAHTMRCNDPELRRHVTSRLFASCIEDPTQYALALVAVWVVGEYADSVLNTEVEVLGANITITEEKLLEMFDLVLSGSIHTQAETVQLVSTILTSVIKLSVKFKSPKNLERLRLVLNAHTTDDNLEIQTRSIEYQQIFGLDEKLRKGLLARMPPPPVKERKGFTLQGESKLKPVSTRPSTVAAGSQTADLLDFLDDSPAPQPASDHGNGDLLSDIFGSQSRPDPLVQDLQSINIAHLGGLRNSSEIEAFNDGKLRIGIVPGSFGHGTGTMEAFVTSLSPGNRIDHVQLLFAVSKSQKLTISTVTGSDSLVSSPVIKQVLKISGKEGAKVKLRVKVKYNVDGISSENQFDFSGVSSTL